MLSSNSSNCEKVVPCIPPPTIITTNQCPQPHDDHHLQNQMGCCSSGRVMIKKAAGGEEGDQLLLLQQQQLKCPRCDSSNTKFCYYNNYSLSQPRHFCKACKRYWTRGGTLRNIPVGGGCRSRNNKRFIKTSTSTTDHHITTTTTSSSSTPTPHNNYNYLSQPSLQLHNIIHTHPDLFYHGTGSSLLSNINNNSFLPISSFNNSSSRSTSGVYNDLMKASTRLGFAASTDEINGFSSILRSSSSTCDHSSSNCKPVMIMPNNLVQHNHGLKNGSGSTTDDHHGSIFQGLNTIEQMQTAIISNGNGMMKGNQVQEQENRSLDLDDHQCINVGLMFDHPTTNSFNYWNTASAAMGVWSSSTHHQTT